VISDVDYSGFLYITVHVDYGLKKTGGYDNIDGSAVNSVEIENYGDYEFSFAIDGNSLDTQTIQNMNLFKHDPGFMGIVSDEMGNPLEGRTVRIYGPDDELLATLNTNEDGFYSFYYKHKGRQAYYTIEVETMGGLKLSQQVLLKSNKFAVVNFEI
jgi:hypothetical protein